MSKKKESKNAFEFPFELDVIFRPDNFSKLSDWQQEIVGFYSRRFNEYSKLPERLSECREPKDLFEFQTEFYNKLFADYRKEASVVSEIMFDIARPVAEKSGNKEAKSYEETILKAQEDAEQIIGLAKQQAEKILEGAQVQAESGGKRKRTPSKIA